MDVILLFPDFFTLQQFQQLKNSYDENLSVFT